jgi:hypothetical protein
VTDLANPNPGPAPGPDPDPQIDSRWLPLLDLWHDDEDTDDQLTTDDQPEQPEPQP